MQIDTEEFDCFQIDSWGRNEQELLLADVSGESWFDDEKSLRKRNIFDVLGTSDEWIIIMAGQGCSGACRWVAQTRNRTDSTLANKFDLA